MAAYQQSFGRVPRHGQRALRPEPLRPETREEPIRRLPPRAVVSCQEYERLLAGETVSWNQILREHPMLGMITVAQLVNAGVVRVMPHHDPSAGTTDFRLCKVERSGSNRAEDASARRSGVMAVIGEAPE